MSRTDHRRSASKPPPQPRDQAKNRSASSEIVKQQVTLVTEQEPNNETSPESSVGPAHQVGGLSHLLRRTAAGRGTLSRCTESESRTCDDGVLVTAWVGRP